MKGVVFLRAPITVYRQVLQLVPETGPGQSSKRGETRTSAGISPRCSLCQRLARCCWDSPGRLQVWFRQENKPHEDRTVNLQGCRRPQGSNTAAVRAVSQGTRRRLARWVRRRRGAKTAAADCRATRNSRMHLVGWSSSKSARAATWSTRSPNTPTPAGRAWGGAGDAASGMSCSAGARPDVWGPTLGRRPVRARLTRTLNHAQIQHPPGEPEAE